MPVLQIADQEGRMTNDALAVIMSTMHFPSPQDKDKRARLADWYRALKLRSRLDLDDPADDHTHTLRASEIDQLFRARNLPELVPDLKVHCRDGFLAGHWLTFRIYASQNDPVLNSNNRWFDYASKFLGPKMTTNGWVWPSDSTDLRTALKTFGPVAHLWAAVTQDQHFRNILLRDRKITTLPKASWATITGQGATKLAGLAQDYYQLAIGAGLYADPRSALKLEDTWALPELIAASPISVDHPDHLLEVDFDVLKSGYVPESHANKNARKERRQQARKASKLVRVLEPERSEKESPMASATVVRPLLRRPRPPLRAS